MKQNVKIVSKTALATRSAKETLFLYEKQRSIATDNKGVFKFEYSKLHVEPLLRGHVTPNFSSFLASTFGLNKDELKKSTKAHTGHPCLRSIIDILCADNLTRMLKHISKLDSPSVIIDVGAKMSSQRSMLAATMKPEFFITDDLLFEKAWKEVFHKSDSFDLKECKKKFSADPTILDSMPLSDDELLHNRCLADLRQRENLSDETMDYVLSFTNTEIIGPAKFSFDVQSQAHDAESIVNQKGWLCIVLLNDHYHYLQVMPKFTLSQEETDKTGISTYLGYFHYGIGEGTMNAADEHVSEYMSAYLWSLVDGRDIKVIRSGPDVVTSMRVGFMQEDQKVIYRDFKQIGRT